MKERKGKEEGEREKEKERKGRTEGGVDTLTDTENPLNILIGFTC
jgi:hypothetical protein